MPPPPPKHMTPSIIPLLPCQMCPPRFFTIINFAPSRTHVQIKPWFSLLCACFLSFVDCNVSDLFPPGNGNCSNGLCVEVNGTSVGDIATYFVTSGYCIISTSGLTRECQEDRSWSGSVPRTLKGNTEHRNDGTHILCLSMYAV